ncbi:hypothetical protein PFICI_00299 [Pestalotiopsis fici W106-1]|uniref:Aldose 1-epimerase n=1 Tax=Pestalotiopsis fici (strain W106-1 / CGMCC3.15140) TaxID=1229662 RepID=W3XMG2_PESFW|nr:uncharacterized protein PFICI_00299 [Pestalotiopsis fici W106-1]ETS86471.1 hypothetical protein PFICI_00299 [Pestalotiopsis fici W106-1]
MVSYSTLAISIWATVKAVWRGDSPFAGYTAMHPVNEEGKYVIQAEGIRLAFTNLNGGAPTNLWINDTNGNEIDVLLGLEQARDYANYTGLLGGAIGRVAGHISGAKFDVDGHTYHLSANGNNGTSTYDGGARGWSRMALDVGSHTKNSITFAVFDRPGKNGFPGSCGSSLTHSVYPNEWRISYGVTPSRTDHAIPISLSHQTFWNLDGFATGTVSEQTLHLPFSGMRLEQDDHGIPTGDIKGNIKDSCHDFWSSPKVLVTRRSPWEKDSNPVATLSSPRSGIKVDLYTDQEAIRLLTWDGGMDSNLTLKSAQGGAKVVRNAALSIQMQDWPDALRPWFTPVH